MLSMNANNYVFDFQKTILYRDKLLLQCENGNNVSSMTNGGKHFQDITDEELAQNNPLSFVYRCEKKLKLPACTDRLFLFKIEIITIKKYLFTCKFL
jgi:hypothetical protein